MILLKLQGEKVIGVVNGITPNYKPKDNEMVVESLPQVSLEKGERAYIYYRNGHIEYEILNRS
jgi:hypothetical protein